MIKKIFDVLCNISKLKQQLIEEKTNDNQLAFYLVFTFISVVPLIFKAKYKSNLTQIIYQVCNSAEWVLLPIACYYIHKKYKMSHFVEKYIAILTVSMIRLMLFLIPVGLGVNIIYSLLKNYFTENQFLKTFTITDITYTMITLCLIYPLWQYLDLAQRETEYKSNPDRYKAIMKTEELEIRETPKGLGGWLALVGIGIIIAPLKMLIDIFSLYIDTFLNGSWEMITTPGSETYHFLWGPFLLGEITINTGLFIARLYLIYLFFSKKKFFPKLYIGIAIFNFLFILADSVMMKFIDPDSSIFDKETLFEMMKVIVPLLIWAPYMFVSKRVKATFIR